MSAGNEENVSVRESSANAAPSTSAVGIPINAANGVSVGDAPITNGIDPDPPVTAANNVVRGNVSRSVPHTGIRYGLVPVLTNQVRANSARGSIQIAMTNGIDSVAPPGRHTTFNALTRDFNVLINTATTNSRIATEADTGTDSYESDSDTTA
ncbi:uncharacterized protein LOC119687456 [Teleopsis dalmanni]|uniref:uncharacterized protein LOC119687456 n=1 Tax=Teleopsis dalmanni TaxID=139649 RepID=UPI0018CEB7E6|nr:uncharacterized protein LOC119687456 [Teleopsis dalmanni]